MSNVDIAPRSVVSATSVELRLVEAEITVNPHKGNDIIYTIVGPDDQTEGICTSIKNSTLFIETPNETSLSSSESTVKITIEVPRGTPIIIDRVRGDIFIGDVESRLTAYIDGKTELYAGKVTDVLLEGHGMSHVEIDNVSRSIDACANDACMISIMQKAENTLQGLRTICKDAGMILVGGDASLQAVEANA